MSATNGPALVQQRAEHNASTPATGRVQICPVCLNALKEPSLKFRLEGRKEQHRDGLVVVRGACGHSFHKDCISRWLENSADGRCAKCSKLWRPEAEAQVMRVQEARQQGSSDAASRASDWLAFVDYSAGQCVRAACARVSARACVRACVGACV